MTARPATLLGGRVRYAQPESGHRSGLEPVLLAAATPARPGETVLEAGSGAGAALLCLATRIPGVAGLGVEQDPALVAMARDNAAANGFMSLAFAACDVATLPAETRFDHAIANPPWHDALGTPGADAARERARRGQPGLIATWVRAMAGAVRPRGTVTLIVAAGVVPQAMAAMAAAGAGSVRLIPFWPRAGVAAKLAIVQGVRGGRGPMVLAPGLILHEADGRFTRAADAVLADGGPIG